MTALERLWHRIRLKFRRIRHGETPRRYAHLTAVIRETKARRLLEIGTWDGVHATQMIAAAQDASPTERIEYFGLDLFEWLDDERLLREVSKRPPERCVVERRLHVTGAEVRLFQGDSIDLLPRLVPDLPQMDFVFIDGGHSYDTVLSDWLAVERLMHSKTVVLFDDYWNTADAGTNRVVASIDPSRFLVEILQPEDEFLKDWGLLKIRFVKVRRRLPPLHR